MKIRQLVKLTNTYITDEQLVYQKLVPFYDAVIDDINRNLDSKFPSLSELPDTDLDNLDYNYFPDQYCRSVLALGAAHKYYVMDEEGITYDTAYEMDYERNLFYMTRDYIDKVPIEFQADNTASVIIDLDRDVDYALPICPGILRGL